MINRFTCRHIKFKIFRVNKNEKIFGEPSSSELSIMEWRWVCVKICHYLKNNLNFDLKINMVEYCKNIYNLIEEDKNFIFFFFMIARACQLLFTPIFSIRGNFKELFKELSAIPDDFIVILESAFRNSTIFVEFVEYKELEHQYFFYNQKANTYKIFLELYNNDLEEQIHILKDNNKLFNQIKKYKEEIEVLERAIENMTRDNEILNSKISDNNLKVVYIHIPYMIKY